jgi:hypothetical protein
VTCPRCSQQIAECRGVRTANAEHHARPERT